MGKISKEFWVNSEVMDIIKRDLYENIIISRIKSTSKIHRITVSYEIDREVTIKESDIDRLFSNNIRFTYKDIEIMKRLFFGGGENDV